MPSTADSLYGIASELLATAVAILAGTAAGAPANQYVSHGPPAYDCPNTVAVNAGMIQYAPNLQKGPGGIFDPRMDVQILVPLTITALRCATALPQGGAVITLPTAAKINADAQMVYADGWSLFCGVRNANRDGTLFTHWPCRVLEIDSAIPIAPEGGVLGWSLTLHIQLDGFDPVGA